jgi:maleamate amidohydrolase
MDELDRRVNDALADLHARGMARTLGFGSRPAVVVVDLTRGFTDPQMPLAAALDEEVGATARLLDAARVASVPIYFANAQYDDHDLADAGVWAQKIPANASLRAGTAGAQLDPRLSRRPEEPVVVKRYASAFFGTDLASRLTSRTIDTVLIAGCTTSGCVRATAVDGLQHGFRVMVVREAVGDRSSDAHLQSIIDIQGKYGDVVSLASAEGYLASLVREGVS